MKDSATAPRPLGWAAAASALLVGGAHLAITGGAALAEPSGPALGDLVWVLLPPALTLLPTVAALRLVRPGRARWALWTCGITAALAVVLAVMGLTPLAFGADPLSLFQGPGPYALLAAVLFTIVTRSAQRARREPHQGDRSEPSPGNGPGDGRTRV